MRSWPLRDPAHGWLLVAVGSAAFFWLVLTLRLLPVAAEYEAARERATALSRGLVTSVEERPGGRESVITVRWEDAVGASHHSQFHLVGADYHRHDWFMVRYEPGNPAQGFPDAAESARVLGERVRLLHLLGTVAAGGLVLLWLIRLGLWRQAAAQPAVPGRATVLRGVSGGNLVGSAWLLVGPGTERLRYHIDMPLEALPEEDSVRFQRVMWHPALDTLTPDTPVSIHGDTRQSARVHISLPDGTPMRPSGRLRRRRPIATVLVAREEQPDRRTTSWLAVGAVTSFVVGAVLVGGRDTLLDLVYVLPALAMAVLNIWAWTGGDPT